MVTIGFLSKQIDGKVVVEIKTGKEQAQKMTFFSSEALRGHIQSLACNGEKLELDEQVKSVCGLGPRWPRLN